MLENIECLGHSTIKFNNSKKIIYFDPYNIKENYNDADMIFITHDHYDHFSTEDIKKVKKDNTIIVVTEDIYQKALKIGFSKMNIVTVKPNNNYLINNIKFTTIPAYNINKQFHPKENNWVGYIIEFNSIKYYIAGDTDVIDENINIECDVAFLPVGGTYTMTYEEAAILCNIMQPKLVVPIHYGVLVGSKKDAESFKKLVDNKTNCKIMY